MRIGGSVRVHPRVGTILEEARALCVFLAERGGGHGERVGEVFLGNLVGEY
jgi:hypothetical protein